MKNIESVRLDILSRAQALFARYGFDKTTLSEITSGNGRCKSSIYYHFKNKEEIFKGVVAMEFETMRKELGKVLEYRAENPFDSFAGYIRRRIELLDGAVVYGNALTSHSPLSRLLIAASRESFDKWEKEYFSSVWKEGIEVGDIPSGVTCVAFSNTLSGILKAIEAQYFTSADKESVKELCATMTELLIHRNPNLNHAH